MEQFEPKKYEAYLSALQQKGPFTVWSGKIWFHDKPQFPPHWGHPTEVESIFLAVESWFDILSPNQDISVIDIAIDRPYIVDSEGNIILSLALPNAVAFLKWLMNGEESGGIVGLLERHKDSGE